MRIRTMTAADLAAAMRLKAQAGWNQLDADWLRFLSMQPDGCFLAEENGAALGTAVACIFGDVTWLAMVLVDREARGRGIGTALVRHALAFVDGRPVRGVRLDATPLGRPMYEKFGFAPEYSLARHEGTLPAVAPAPGSRVATAQSADYEAIFALDRDVTGADRRKFLIRLFEERPDLVDVVYRDGVVGYMTVRPGSNGFQLGPCAADGAAAADLIHRAAGRLAGRRALLDIPVDNPAAIRLAESLNLKASRTFVRMLRGTSRGDDIERLWASSGPELG